MIRKYLSRPVLWKVARRCIASLLLVLASLYGLLGNELLQRAYVWSDGWVRLFSDAWAARRLDVMSIDVQQSATAFVELLAQREALDEQIRVLETQRVQVASRHERDATLAQSILAVLAGNASVPGGNFSRSEVERDAAEALERVHAGRRDLHNCDAMLDKLCEARSTLDGRIAAAQRTLQLRMDHLHLSKAGFAGHQAYSRGLDAARGVADGERHWELEISPNPKH